MITRVWQSLAVTRGEETTGRFELCKDIRVSETILLLSEAKRPRVKGLCPRRETLPGGHCNTPGEG